MQVNPKGFVMMLLIGALVLTGCGTNSAAQQPPAALTKVNIQLGWTHEYSTAEFHAAVKNGRFAEQHLSVELREGGFKDGKAIAGIEEVVSGNADFGLTGDIALLKARSEGAPVVAIAAVMSRSPVAIISLPKSNIRRPQDLIGHKVAVADGGSRYLFDTLLSAEKIDPTKVEAVKRTSFGVEPLVKGEVDALVGWIINEAVMVRQAGFEPNIMLLSDYGIESYNTLLFTTEKTINEKPALVEQVLAATLKGIQDVVQNPDQAIDYTMIYAPKLNREDQKQRLLTRLPLLNPAGSKPGMMDDNTWKATYQMAVDQKVVTKPIDFTTAYTMSFLNKFYK
jgi:NitT/TauT family transport system substrate-binding protein